LRHDFATFEACLAGDLSAPVEHCGRWTLYDLANHLGQGNMWAAVAVTDQHGDYEGPAAPRDREALAAWFRDTCGVLLAALDTDPLTSAWTIAPRAGDTESSWILGTGEPVATIDATAATLLLLLWGRVPASAPAISWDGDRQQALATLSGALVP
jgi:hypothetical protein